MKALFEFELPKPPRTKKNHGSVKYSFRKQRKVHVPSEAWSTWLAWCQTAMPEIRRAAEAAGVGLPITIDVNCRAVFYRQTEVGDAVGYYQGLADVLERLGVVRNDIQIVSWDGTRLRKDADDPRTVVILEPILAEPPLEKKARKR